MFNLRINKELAASRKWFKEAKLGMFIHWGLYSIPAGEWEGKSIPWLSEWIMHTAKIPIREYEKLASQFNPDKFNPREWVDLAQKAGMKYLIFTAKHHDGFAMYHSKADRFNVIDSTPFKRDIVAELAKACEGTPVRLGLYYSQAMDWHEPHGSNSFFDRGYGNNWDFPYGTPEGFSEYMERKVRPQLRELLTQYGPLAVLWFDNPMPSFNKIHAREVKELVRELQPGCLISARIGHGLGDIIGLGDNCLPEERVDMLGEACVTMNETWGYKKNSSRWSSVEEVKDKIEKANSRGYNLLLNVGPKSDGSFPQEAITLLEKLSPRNTS